MLNGQGKQILLSTTLIKTDYDETVNFGKKFNIRYPKILLFRQIKLFFNWQITKIEV